MVRSLGNVTSQLLTPTVITIMLCRTLKPTRRRRSAFTYVDMVLTLFIIGILSAVALPRFSASLDAHRVDGATRCISHDLALARTLARHQSRETVVEFTLDPPSYRISGADNLDRPHDAHEVNLNDAGFRVEFSDVSFDGNIQLAFDMHGTPYSIDSAGTRVPLQNGQITIAAGASSRTLQVEPVTGTVR